MYSQHHTVPHSPETLSRTAWPFVTIFFRAIFFFMLKYITLNTKSLSCFCPITSPIILIHQGWSVLVGCWSLTFEAFHIFSLSRVTSWISVANVFFSLHSSGLWRLMLHSFSFPVLPFYHFTSCTLLFPFPLLSVRFYTYFFTFSFFIFSISCFFFFFFTFSYFLPFPFLFFSPFPLSFFSVSSSSSFHFLLIVFSFPVFHCFSLLPFPFFYLLPIYFPFLFLFLSFLLSFAPFPFPSYFIFLWHPVVFFCFPFFSSFSPFLSSSSFSFLFVLYCSAFLVTPSLPYVIVPVPVL